LTSPQVNQTVSWFVGKLSGYPEKQGPIRGWRPLAYETLMSRSGEFHTYSAELWSQTVKQLQY